LDKILDKICDFGCSKNNTLDSMFVQSLVICEENVNLILCKNSKHQLKYSNKCDQSSAEY